MMATYYVYIINYNKLQNSDALLKTTIFPFFTFFDTYITPRLVKYIDLNDLFNSACNWMLYYVIVILLPFINQEELEKMRDYSNKIIEIANQKIIKNQSVFLENNSL